MDFASKIDRIMAGYREAMVLAAANRTGLFGALADGPRTADQVAAGLNLDARAVATVLRALVASGLVGLEGEAFYLDPVAAPYLLPEGTETKTSIIAHNATMMHSWILLPEVLVSGKPADRPERTDREVRDFILGMENVSRVSSREVAARIDLSGARRMLDVGGGPGTAALTFARENPDLRCVIFDLPQPVAIAQEQIAAAGLADRVGVAAGDFLVDPLPPADDGRGYDLIYVSNIVHMLPAEGTLDLLRKCRDVAAVGGRILVKDFFLEDSRTEPAMAALFSVNMLVATEGGKSYTRSETCDLLAEAGFSVEQVVPVPVHSEVICARRES